MRHESEPVHQKFDALRAFVLPMQHEEKFIYSLLENVQRSRQLNAQCCLLLTTIFQQGQMSSSQSDDNIKSA
jgi:hypothetical protein